MRERCGRECDCLQALLDHHQVGVEYHVTYNHVRSCEQAVLNYLAEVCKKIYQRTLEAEVEGLFFCA
jgi:hypothetical protein